MGRNRWWRHDLRRADTLANGAAPGGATVHVIDTGLIGVPMLSVNDNAAGVVYSGAGWLSVSNGSAYNGDYNRTATATDTVTYTTPASTVRVGLRTPYSTNAGLTKIHIDNDATRATLLPTAQDLVTAGTFPNTILVANGGTLSPTDRVLDQYVTPTTIFDDLLMLADDLAAGVHTVKLTCTGYKRAASSDIRTYVGGFMYGTDMTVLDTASTVLAPLRVLTGAPPGATTAINGAWEYAHEITPTGATTPAFVGNYHGYELQDSITFSVDGTVLSLTDGQRVSGYKAVATRASRLRHPETGSTDIATVTTIYTMSVEGLRIQHTTTWLVAVSVSRSYSAMMMLLQSSFDKGTIDTAVPFALTAHAGTFSGNVPGRVIAIWDSRSNGKVAAALYVPQPEITLNNYLNSAPLFLAVQDNSASATVKGYATRVSTGAGAVSVSASSIWTSDSYRKVAWLPQGADAFFGSV